MTNKILEEMLLAYDIEDFNDKTNAMKEIIQEIVLCGLSKAGFFERASFYGGTALRIFYGLNRFSEDLDFSLDTKDPNFDLTSYFPILEKEVKLYDLNVQIKECTVHSDFLKGNTKEYLLLFYDNCTDLNPINKNDVVKIKINTNPSQYINYEQKFRMIPRPYSVRMYDSSSLFSGTLHTIIYRGLKNRIKGQDLYDYLFYLSKGISVNLHHLKARLIDSIFIAEKDDCSMDAIKTILNDIFAKIDYKNAKEDVIPFIKDKSVLNIWSADYFKDVTSSLLK